MKKKALFFIFSFFGIGAVANATLIDNGNGTITQIKDDPTYGDGSRLMWLKDSTAAAGSSLDNGTSNNDSRMTYDNARAWINQLNDLNYLGYSDWRLPRNLPVDGIAHNGTPTCDGSTDNSYNIYSPDAELAYLFYKELGNIGSKNIDCSDNTEWVSGVWNMGPFEQIQFNAGIYWSSETDWDQGSAFHFYFRIGEQLGVSKGAEKTPWAVRDCPECAPIQVQIDIKPDSEINTINLGSNGLIPVAIISDDGFDATRVNPDTVDLAGATVAIRGKGSKLMANAEDVNVDGLLDLVIHVSTVNLDPSSLQSGSAKLVGNTENGNPIEGIDSITIIPE